MNLKERLNNKNLYESLIQTNSRLILNIVKDYSYHGISLIDLIAKGHLELFKSIESFDLNKGIKFSIYASWCIKSAIYNDIEKKKRKTNLARLIGSEV